MPRSQTGWSRRIEMRRRELVACAGSLLLPCTDATWANPAAEVIDLMPDFWRIHDQPHTSARERALALLQGFFAPHAATYARAGLRLPEPEALQRWLAEITGLVPLMRLIHVRFLAAYKNAQVVFKNNFPDFEAKRSPVFLMPSLLRFDAHLEPRGFDQPLPLFFGVDGMARFHGATGSVSVLFAHEMFHCYHAQRSPELMLDPQAPVYAAVWTEGLATWVSQALNPEATALQILLDDKRLATDGPRSMKLAAREMLATLDSRQDTDLAKFVSYGWKGAWPARIGYLVGARIARQAAKTSTLSELASLDASGARAVMRAGLQRMLVAA